MAVTSSIRRRGVGLVIAGPSGVGKTSITRSLLASEPESVLSISVTTRPPRGGEVEGVHYHFRTRAEFESLAAAGELLESAEVFDHRYGTLRDPVVQSLSRGRDVLFDIDWQGHLRLRAALPGDVVGIFVVPTSRSDLESRLATRNEPPATIARRMAGATGELAHWQEFDHVIVNEDLHAAVRAVRSILEAARLTTARQTCLADFMTGLL